MTLKGTIWRDRLLQGLKPDVQVMSFIGPTKIVPLSQGLWSGRLRELFRMPSSLAFAAAPSGFGKWGVN